MVDLNTPPHTEDSIRLTAEEAAEAIKQDIDGTIDIQISNLANGDVGIEDETGMSEDDNDNVSQEVTETSEPMEPYVSDRHLVEREREVAHIAANANELTTQMGDATIAILKLLNYYDVAKMPYTIDDIERVIPQLTGVGMTRDASSKLIVMLLQRDFITGEPRFSESAWTITPRGRAFLIIDCNLSNVSSL